MPHEYVAFGPPGTGKTRWLAGQIHKALDRYVPQGVVACSFTRAAAHELAGRDTGLPRENIGTIHSLCYHALGCPPIIETQKDAMKEWNELYPQLPVKADANLDEPEKAEGDMLAEWNRRRAIFDDARALPYPFASLWEEFKRERGLYDFTDLLLKAPEHLDAEVLVVDEAQDMSPLQWRIVRRWGATAQVFILAGDDDQCIYQFLGASPAELLDGGAERLHLRKSHRLSRAVYERAEQWVARLDRREPKDYEPRADGGTVERAGHRLDPPEALAAELADRAKEQTVMVLAACGYMLRPLAKALKDRGVPFHNPYRRRRGDWNPMRGPAQLLLAFDQCAESLRQPSGSPLPDARTWRRWISPLKARDLLPRGAKRQLREHEGDVTEGHLERWLTPPILEALKGADVEWLVAHMLKDHRERCEYPLAVWRGGGQEALRKRPKLILGTIHSVKGGEADAVYLFPDLSFRAKVALEKDREAARAALVRQFYVGMTRAREDLALCASSSKYFVRW